MSDIVIKFIRNVHEQPQHPAVVEGSDIITYADLGVVAAGIADRINVVPGAEKILLYLPQGAVAYAAMFGALLAGGYYCPINMEAPIERRIEVIEQFQPHVIVSTRNLIEELTTIDVDANFIDVDNLPSAKIENPTRAHEIAYVIFTSGSTGKPKGVIIPRAALSHYTDWAIRDMEVRPEDRWSQHPNIAFDLSVLDIYGALCGGATLYPITTKKDRMLPANFIAKCRLTIWNSVPSVIDLMTKARQLTPENIATLRLATFCGEPLYPRHLEAIFEANKNVTIHNTYGPTEATVSCSLVRISADNYQEYCGNSVALGSPISGMEFHLMGGDSREGELILLGEQLALGYWENVIETDRAFIELDRDGEKFRAYRTGDWVSIKDGQYYFVSRIDSQVKIRGNRVELDEIDAKIYELGFGESCTVLSDGKLHSFILTGEMPELGVLRQSLAARLPDYELPEFIHALDDFPRNSNDKIDRRKLVELIK